MGGTGLIYHGDCLKVMPALQKVDMILTDLPYGETRHKEDIVINMGDMWVCFEELISENGVIALNASFKFAQKLLQFNRVPFRYEIVWDKVLKTGFLNAKRMPLRQHEFVLIFYKKLPVYNPQFTKGPPLHSKGVSYMDKEHKNQNYGKFHMTDDSRKGSTDKYPSSILRIQKPHPSKAKHRTEKPIELQEWLIKTYTNPGMTVLDCCAGSGSTGFAARNLNRKYVLIEKNKKMYKELVKEL